MGGFGGALKNISIGLASSRGKAYIHGAGDLEKAWSAEQNSFLESMADAAKTIMEYYDGRIVFVNVMKNLSVDCDCCAVAEDPAMADIGILSSLDPVPVSCPSSSSCYFLLHSVQFRFPVRLRPPAASCRIPVNSALLLLSSGF